MKKSELHLLFSYGTLQMEQVQIETYGRTLKGKADRLSGYRIEDLIMEDETVLETSGVEIHPVAVPTGNQEDIISGVIYEISEEELHETDKYETSAYARIEEVFESGTKAWIYIDRKYQ